MRRGRAIGVFMNITCGLLFCLIMSIIVLFRNEQMSGLPSGTLLNVKMVAFSVIQAFFVSYTIGDLVPSYNWGTAFCAKNKMGKIPSYFITIAIHAFIICTICSFICTFVAVDAGQFSPATLIAWWTNYPILLVAAYLLMVVAMGPLQKVAFAITANITD